MDYRKAFQVKPGTKVKLSEIDPGYTGTHGSEKHAQADIGKYLGELNKQQHLLYAEKNHALLIVLQAPDAGGKDGTIDHVMSAMNPQGTVVTGFKQPTAEELDHDFLWRVHRHAPAREAWPSSTALTMRMCSWRACISWSQSRSGRNGTS